ncbi:MAG: HD domain-containing protein [Marinilabiliales bacterium]
MYEEAIIKSINHLKQIKLFDIVSDILYKNNIKGYLIGGYVRDLILGIPSKDIDIVVTADGIDFAHKLAKALNVSNVSVYKNFGTAKIKYNEYDIEIAAARKESYRKNSRKPIVYTGTIEDDQKRRDFTINALAFSLNKEDFGKFIDPFDGLSDLKKKIIRTPLDPDVTFSDDPLRMIRAVRFACKLNFKIDKITFQSIIRQKGRLEILSVERISDELHKIISYDRPSRGFQLLDKTGILELLLPELTQLKGVDVIDNQGHKDNFQHSLKVLDNISVYTDNIWLRWAALLHDIGKAPTKKFDQAIGWTFHGHDHYGSKMVEVIFARLKFPLNDKLKYVQKLIALHLRPIALVSDEVSDSAIRRLLFDAGDDIDDLMLLAKADITSKNQYKIKQFRKNFNIVKKKLIEVEQKDKIRNWQPPINGEEIMKTFNIPPSKIVGTIKTAIKDAILDGIIENNYEAAYNYMLKIAKELGLKSNK